jgi:hypothetical protein
MGYSTAIIRSNDWRLGGALPRAWASWRGQIPAGGAGAWRAGQAGELGRGLARPSFAPPSPRAAFTRPR